jgi:hypothetical protein
MVLDTRHSTKPIPLQESRSLTRRAKGHGTFIVYFWRLLSIITVLLGHARLNVLKGKVLDMLDSQLVSPLLFKIKEPLEHKLGLLR